MEQQQQPEQRHRARVIEAAMILVILLALLGVLYSMMQSQGEKAKRVTCLSNIREISTMVQMYTQDFSGRYPGMSWKPAIELYCGYDTSDDRTKFFMDHLKKHRPAIPRRVGEPMPMPPPPVRIPGCKYDSRRFHCPNDTNLSPDAVSYAYDSELLRPDGSGVNEAEICSPVDLGIFCDAAPSGQVAGVIGAGTNVESALASMPCLRHHGIVIGYCDGHAKYYPLTGWDPQDSANPINTAFYLGEKLDFIEKKDSGSKDK